MKPTTVGVIGIGYAYRRFLVGQAPVETGRMWDTLENGYYVDDLYGKTIVLRHGATYTTLYAHMSRFARGLRRGKQVTQGQTIGYIGSTGLATGPHLHYEFRVRGVHRNPLRVKLPTAAPIEKQHKQDFLAKTRDMVARLDVVNNPTLAAGERSLTDND